MYIVRQKCNFKPYKHEHNTTSMIKAMEKRCKQDMSAHLYYQNKLYGVTSVDHPIEDIILVNGKYESVCGICTHTAIDWIINDKNNTPTPSEQ